LLYFFPSFRRFSPFRCYFFFSTLRPLKIVLSRPAHLRSVTYLLVDRLFDECRSSFLFPFSLTPPSPFFSSHLYFLKFPDRVTAIGSERFFLFPLCPRYGAMATAGRAFRTSALLPFRFFPLFPHEGAFSCFCHKRERDFFLFSLCLRRPFSGAAAPEAPFPLPPTLPSSSKESFYQGFFPFFAPRTLTLLQDWNYCSTATETKYLISVLFSPFFCLLPSLPSLATICALLYHPRPPLRA